MQYLQLPTYTSRKIFIDTDKAHFLSSYRIQRAINPYTGRSYGYVLYLPSGVDSASIHIRTSDGKHVNYLDDNPSGLGTACVSKLGREFSGHIIDRKDNSITLRLFDSQKTVIINQPDVITELPTNRALYINNIDSVDGNIEISYISSKIYWRPSIRLQGNKLLVSGHIINETGMDITTGSLIINGIEVPNKVIPMGQTMIGMSQSYDIILNKGVYLDLNTSKLYQASTFIAPVDLPAHKLYIYTMEGSLNSVVDVLAVIKGDEINIAVPVTSIGVTAKDLNIVKEEKADRISYNLINNTAADIIVNVSYRIDPAKGFISTTCTNTELVSSAAGRIAIWQEALKANQTKSFTCVVNYA